MVFDRKHLTMVMFKSKLGTLNHHRSPTKVS